MPAIWGHSKLKIDRVEAMGALLGHHGRPQYHISGSYSTCASSTTEAEIFHSPHLVISLCGFAISPRGAPITASDLASSFEMKGPVALNDLNGHYACAVYVIDSGTLYLARDPFGVMPLSYALFDDSIAFSSEYKSLLALDGIDTSVDRDGVNSFLYNGWAPPGRTFFAGIKSVTPGTALVVSAAGTHTTIRLSPDPAKYPSPAGPISPREVLDTLDQTISSYLPDKNLKYAVSLSGGVDSALITALVKKNLGSRPLGTFTVGFGEDDPDIVGARHTASVLGTDHREIIVRPSDLYELFPATVWTLEDPGGYDAFTHLYALARFVGGKADVLFSGNVCDTLFAGMPNHRRAWLASKLPFGRAIASEFYRAQTTGRLPVSILARSLWRMRISRNPLPAPTFVSTEAKRLVADDLDGLQLRQPLFGLLQKELTAWDNRMGAQQALASRFGLSFRMPFSDKRLIEVALRIPDQQKMSVGSVKTILRQAAALVLPSSITERPKYIQQFGLDDQLSEVLDDFVRRLFDDGAEGREIVCRESLAQLRRKDHRPYGHLEVKWLWNAIAVELWASTFLDRRQDFLAGDRHQPPSALLWSEQTSDVITRNIHG
jgi:asparagine synthase (glutamine-hydrolysing)